MFIQKAIRPVSSAIMDEIFEVIFGAELTSNGFQYIHRRKWVRSRVPEIRDLFAIQALKGANFSPLWGFSLDYVPHQAGKKVLWHRTPKSARFDLRYDLMDFGHPDDVDRRWVIPSLYGKQEAERFARRVMKNALPQALEFFDQVTRIDDLPKVFEDLMKKPAIRFSFSNYVQQPLAYAFTLAKLKRYNEAEAILKRYVAEYGLSPDIASHLQRLLAKLRQS